MKSVFEVFDRAMESRWVHRVKEGREFLFLIAGVGAFMVLLLREAEVEIRQSYRLVKTPRQIASLLEKEESLGELGRHAGLILKSSALLSIEVENQTSRPIEMKYLKLILAGSLLDYSVSWGNWEGLLPSEEGDILVSCCSDGALEFPFLSTLPPRSVARIDLWVRPSLGARPKILASAEDASIAFIEDSRPSQVAVFVDRNLGRIAVLVGMFLVWKYSRLLDRIEDRDGRQ